MIRSTIGSDDGKDLGFSRPLVRVWSAVKFHGSRPASYRIARIPDVPRAVARANLAQEAAGAGEIDGQLARWWFFDAPRRNRQICGDTIMNNCSTAVRSFLICSL